MKTKLTLLGLSLLASLSANAATVFTDSNFASPVGIQGGVLFSYANYDQATAPLGEVFLGEYDNETASLSLFGLPAHNNLTVSLDFYALNSWDGDSTGSIGPDHWRMAIDGTDYVNNTFAFFTSMTQNYGGAGSPGQTGADAVDTLGYQNTGWGDMIFNLTFTIPHASPTATFDWEAWGLQGFPDEGWGIDNIVVSVDSAENPVPEVHHYATILGAALIATRALRRKP